MTLATLNQTIAAKMAEQEALLGKGAELTAHDVVAAEGIEKELTELFAQKGAIERAQGLKDAAAARQAELARPTAQLPTPAGKQVIGMRASGETLLDATGKNLEVQQLGEGLIGEKQWRAICDPEYKTAFHQYLKVGLGGLSASQAKVLQEGQDSAGGFLVPEDIMNAVIMRQPTPTRVASFCSQFTTSRDGLSIPKVNYSADDLYTSGIRVTWTGEQPATATGHRVTDPVFGQVRVPIYTAMMSQPVTNDLIEDSAVALQPWLENRFFETIELLRDNVVLNGTGAGQPLGMLTNVDGADQITSVNAGAAGAVTADGIVDLAYSLPEQYDENARWIFAKTTTAKAIAKLKDAELRYIWGMGLQDSGLSPTIRDRDLLGYPVSFSAFMPAPANNAFPILFGDLRGYYLVNRVGFSVQVLREIYAETNQILLLGRVRFGGICAEPWRLRAGKTPA